MPSWLKVFVEYGPGTLVVMLAVVAIGWVGRLALKNPVDVLSDTLKSVDAARQALNEELQNKQEVITTMNRQIGELKEMVLQLERELDEMRARYERAENRIQSLKTEITEKPL